MKTRIQHKDAEKKAMRGDSIGGKLNTNGDSCTRTTPGNEPDSLTGEERVARSLAVMGKYAWVPTSSEEYSRRKQSEIDHEDGRP